jgi:hypothetical protein
MPCIQWAAMARVALRPSSALSKALPAPGLHAQDACCLVERGGPACSSCMPHRSSSDRVAQVHAPPLGFPFRAGIYI